MKEIRLKLFLWLRQMCQPGKVMVRFHITARILLASCHSSPLLPVTWIFVLDLVTVLRKSLVRRLKLRKSFATLDWCQISQMNLLALQLHDHPTEHKASGRNTEPEEHTSRSYKGSQTLPSPVTYRLPCLQSKAQY